MAAAPPWRGLIRSVRPTGCLAALEVRSRTTPTPAGLEPILIHPEAHRAAGAAHSKPASMNTSCRPRASAARLTAFDPGTTAP